MNRAGDMFSMKMLKACRRVLLCALFTWSFSGVTFGQSAEVIIKVMESPVARVSVEGVEATGRRRWSFVDAYADATGLSRRVVNFVVLDESGKGVEVKPVGVGEYESAVACRKFRYEVVLTPPDEASTAHLSWLKGERGVLMLNDLLPRSVQRATLRLDVPVGWRRITTEREQGSEFVIENAADSVFVVGRDIREKVTRTGGLEFVFAIEGAWAFSDDEAFAALKELYDAHREVVGDVRRERVLVALQSFPQSVRAENWRAEVRGGTLNYFSGKQPSRAVALGRLSTAMAHELLHLWVPNSLALDGEYSWFYEGFVEYQAMRVCVQLGVVSYQDYLNAIGRAYDSHLASQGKGGASLVELSQRRWANGNQAVYSGGLIAAFLCDLTLRYQSKNKRTIASVFRELMTRHARETRREDGNHAVVKVINDILGSADFTSRFVETAHVIDLQQSVAKFGFRVERVGSRSRISVLENLNKEQSALQRKLGNSY
jgi:hypothetical protein